MTQLNEMTIFVVERLSLLIDNPIKDMTKTTVAKAKLHPNVDLPSRPSSNTTPVANHHTKTTNSNEPRVSLISSHQVEASPSRDEAGAFGKLVILGRQCVKTKKRCNSHCR